MNLARQQRVEAKRLRLDGRIQRLLEKRAILLRRIDRLQGKVTVVTERLNRARIERDGQIRLPVPRRPL